MKKFFLIFFFFAYSLISNSQNAEIKIDTNTILIGQQIKLIVKCEEITPPFIFPSFEDTIISGIEIIKNSSIDTVFKSNKNNTLSLVQEYLITAWDSGAYYIPSYKISDVIKTDPLLLNVLTVAVDQKSDIKDIKKPLDPKLEFSDFLPWLIGLLIVLLLLYLYKKFSEIKKDEKIAPIIKEIIPAHIAALNKLEKIEKEELWQSGKIKEYHSEISETLRKYIEERYKCIALELTTDEILDELENLISKEIYNDLKNILQIADLAKFAKSKPTNQDNLQSMSLSKKFVDTTKLIENQNE